MTFFLNYVLIFVSIVLDTMLFGITWCFSLILLFVLASACGIDDVLLVYKLSLITIPSTLLLRKTWKSITYSHL